MDETETIPMVYQIIRTTDLTEGRESRPDPQLYACEQDAWDEINLLEGVMGRHPSKWKGQRQFLTWQEAMANGATGIDHYVKSTEVIPARPRPPKPSPQVEMLNALTAIEADDPTGHLQLESAARRLLAPAPAADA